MELRVVEDVAAAFADVVAAALPGVLGISGGATAQRCYERLAQRSNIPWPQVDVVVGDERWVPVDHPDSNEGMARRVLLQHVSVGRVWSARNAGAVPEQAADAYDQLVGDLGVIHVLHLGLGDDGHTASLFPGTPALEVTDRFVVVNGDDRHQHLRLTLTYPGIALARLALFTVEGGQKAEPLARMCAGEDVPAARVRAERVLCLADAAAASRLK